LTGAVVVHKLDAHGRETWRYAGRLLDHDGNCLRLEARFDQPDAEFHGLGLRRGDRFVETFYADRWYNIFAVHDVEDDRLKGWYCNITRPARLTETEVHAEDLALDLLVFPDGRFLVLDQDEFEALELTASERRAAQQALRALIRRIDQRRPPFDRIEPGGLAQAPTRP
jgi:uncharacterized protein